MAIPYNPHYHPFSPATASSFDLLCPTLETEIAGLQRIDEQIKGRARTPPFIAYAVESQDIHPRPDERDPALREALANKVNENAIRQNPFSACLIRIRGGS